MIHGTQVFPGVFIAAVCVLVGGCSKSGVATIPVEGQITYGGGDWPKPGMLFFVVEEPAPNFPRKPGTAVFGTDGKFRVKTFAEGDGLIPGKYLVNIECWESPPSMDPGAPKAKSYVPEKLQSGQKNGFKVEISPDEKGPKVLKFDIPKP
jgi:hypothetical protein